MATKLYLAKRGAWRGQTRQTPVGEQDGRLARIINGYVSPDGQAIRRWPGFKCVVNLDTATGWERQFPASFRAGIQHDVAIKLLRPHCFAQVRGRLLFVGESDFQKQLVRKGNGTACGIASYNGVARTLTLDDAASQVQQYNSGSGVGRAGDAPNPGDYLYIEGTFNLALDGRFWRVESIVYGAPSVITLTTVFAGTGVVATPSLSAFYRVRQASAGATTSAADPDGLALWTVPALPNVGTPLVSALPSVAASRNWDYGATPGAGIGWTEGLGGMPRRKSITPPWRVNPDIAGSRLLLGAPGLGIVWQAPLITVPGGAWLPSPDLTNSTADQLRCLGLPKAVLLDPAAKTLANAFLFAPGAGQQALPKVGAGRYTFKVAYRDDATGETGLASEAVEYVVTGAEFVRLWVLHPGYLMGECAATSIVVYMTLEDTTDLGQWRTFGVSLNGQPPKASGTLCSGGLYGDLFQVIDVLIPSSYGRNLIAADLDFKRGPDPLVQMPMGSRSVRTVRGTTVFAGHVGDAGDELHLEDGTATTFYDVGDTTQNRNGRDRNGLVFRNIADNGATDDGGFGVGSGIMPPAYAGREFRSLETLFPSRGTATVRLSRQINQYAFEAAGALSTPFLMWQRWTLGESVHSTATNEQGKRAQLVMPRGLFQWSELGKPGVTPANNQEIVDAEPRADEIEAVGRVGNAAVFATREQTHQIGWNTSPSGQRPTLLSTQFGCIATNSMVEFDGGLAWLSDRGPVALRGGALQWVGQDVGQDFVGREARYQRDSRGKMPHAWACHDTQRRLVMFGLIVSRTGYSMQVENSIATVTYDTATDAQRSKFPCDEVLVWSYATGALSTWRPPQQVHWMQEVICSDGQTRVCFWAQDRRLYALDDAWGGSGELYGSAPSSTVEAASNIFTVANPTFVTTPGVFFVRPGQEYLIYNAADRRIRGYGTIAAFLTSTMVQLSGTHAWSIGDELVWGYQTLEVATNFESFGQEKASIDSIGVRYSLHTPATTTGAYPYGAQLAESLAWCDIDVVTENGTHLFDNRELSKDGRVLFTKDRLLQPGTLTPLAAGHHTTVGRTVAYNSQVVVRFRGAAQVRLSQIEVGVGDA